MTTESRISRLEESVDEIRSDLRELMAEMRSNFRLMLSINITMWVTTMLGIVAALVAIVLKG